MERHETSRRKFVKKMAYVGPVILTLPAAAAYAKKGSDKKPKPNDKGPKGD